MNKEKLIKEIKFHCEQSKKNLLNFHLQNENISEEVADIIKDSFKMLELNLISSINNAE